MTRMARPSFVLGFATAVGGLLALGTVALARPHSAPRPATRSAHGTGAPSTAPLAVLSRPRGPSDDLPAPLVADAPCEAVRVEALEQQLRRAAGGPQ